jgi:hypothetical protein
LSWRRKWARHYESSGTDVADGGARHQLRKYAIVTAAYWAFTLTDGALRMLVLLHLNQLGYRKLQSKSDRGAGVRTRKPIVCREIAATTAPVAVALRGGATCDRLPRVTQNRSPIESDPKRAILLGKWWRGTESNCRHYDFRTDDARVVRLTDNLFRNWPTNWLSESVQPRGDVIELSLKRYDVSLDVGEGVIDIKATEFNASDALFKLNRFIDW